MPPNAKFRRLNGDTSWLVQLPRGEGEGGLFNLLIDPWLDPSPQTEYHPLFSIQQRVLPASHGSIPALAADPGVGRIHAVLISHPFTDHMHAASLAPGAGEEGEKLKLLVAPKARGAVDAMLLREGKGTARMYDGHTIPSLDFEGEAASPVPDQEGLPAGIRIAYVPAREGWRYGPKWGDLHGCIALLWPSAHDGSTSSPSSFSCAIYSPHGTLQSTLPPRLAHARDRVLLQAWDRLDVPVLRYLTGPVSLGYEAVMSCFPASANADAPPTKSKEGGEHDFFAPTVLLRTHDEQKKASGLIAKVIARTPVPASGGNTSSVEAMEELLRSRGLRDRLLRVADLKVGEEITL